MVIEKIEVGELLCNCYLVTLGNYSLLIDPGDDYSKILEFIGKRKVIGILITHGHADHIGCVKKLVEDFSYPLYQFDSLHEGHLDIQDFSIEVLFNPGHSKDSVSYYFEKEGVMFVGDFIFRKTIGRCDLEGGDFGEMLQSLSKMKRYDPNIILYPGHGDKTTLGWELRNNPYFEYI